MVYKARHTWPEPSLGPTLSADRAHDLMRRVGFGYRPDEHPGEQATYAAKLDELGFKYGVIRSGRIPINEANQRAAWPIQAARSIKSIGMPDDYGNPTPESRMAEALDNGADPLCWGGVNEPQANISGSAAWPVGTKLAATAQQNTFGRTEVVRVQQAVWAARGASSRPDIPVNAAVMASKSDTGWYAALEAQAQAEGTSMSAMCDWAEAHHYTSGFEPSFGGWIQKHRLDQIAAYWGAGTPITSVLSETGYHDDVDASGLPLSSGAIRNDRLAYYAPRLFFECLYDFGYDFVLAYELIDDPNPALTLDERHRGIVYDSTWTMKPSGTALKNLFALYTDAASTHTPVALPGSVTLGTGLRYKLHHRSDGKWLLAVWKPSARVITPSTGALLTPAASTITLDLAGVSRRVDVHVPRLGSTPQTTTLSTTSTSWSVAGDLVVAVIT